MVCVCFLLSERVSASSNYFKVKKSELSTFSTKDAEMQNIVKSVALQYLYKQKLTDYEQFSLDYEASGVKSTFSPRNFNMSPLYLSRSNENNFDCSSFITNVYMNAFGFTFSDFYNLSDNAFMDINNNKVVSVSKSSYYDGLINNGKGTSTRLLEKLYNAKENTNGSDYRKLNVNQNSLSDMIVYSVSSGSNDNFKVNSINYKTKKNVKSELMSKLQTGDILLIRERDKVTKSGKVSFENNRGHVLIYVKDSGDVAMKNGFIHSTGVSFPMKKFASIDKEADNIAYGDDEYSVRYASEGSYLNQILSTNTVYLFAIFRPINIIKKGNYTNIYTNSTNSLQTSSNIISLSKKNTIAMQQYVFNSTKAEHVNQYNVINNGDVIRVKSYFKNKGTKTEVFSVDIYYPQNAKYVKGNSVVFEKKGQVNKALESKGSNFSRFNMELAAGQEVYIEYTFTYNYNRETQISLPGMKVYLASDNKSNKVEFPNLTFNVNNNSNNPNLFNTLNNYYGSKQSNNRSNNFVKLYQDVFGVSLKTNSGASLSNEQVSKLVDKVKSELTTCKDNCKNIYMKKLDNSSSKLSSLVVPGMYGGMYLRGNIDGNRIRTISTDYLEAGDIIVAYKNNNSYTFVYGGIKSINQNNRMITSPLGFYQSKNSNNGEVLRCSKNCNNMIKRALTYDFFVVLRPSRVYDLSKINNKLLSNFKESYDTMFLKNSNDDGLYDEEDFFVNDIDMFALQDEEIEEDDEGIVDDITTFEIELDEELSEESLNSDNNVVISKDNEETESNNTLLIFIILGCIIVLVLALVGLIFFKLKSEKVAQ